MKGIAAQLIVLAALVGIYAVLFRRCRPDSSGARSSLVSARAIAFVGIGMKLASLVLDQRLVGVSGALMATTALLAVLHAVKPTWVEAGVSLVLVPALVVEELLGGGQSYAPLLLAWVVMVTVLSLAVVMLRLPVRFLASPWLGGSNDTNRGTWWLAYGGIVAFGFELFDPVWTIALEQWLGTDIGVFWFFVAGFALVGCMAMSPLYTATALGAGLVVAELVVRAVQCAPTDGLDECRSILPILILGIVFVMIRGVVAMRTNHEV